MNLLAVDNSKEVQLVFLSGLQTGESQGYFVPWQLLDDLNVISCGRWRDLGHVDQVSVFQPRVLSLKLNTEYSSYDI